MKIGFIGGGNMAGAIVNGVVASGLCKPCDVTVCDISAEMLKKYDNGIVTSQNNSDALSCDYIVLAVKPFIMSKILEQLASHDLKNKVFISIAAGISVAEIKSVLGKNVKVVRVMPNTPAQVGEGMTVIAKPDECVTESEMLEVVSIFDGVGKTEIMSESMINVVTGVSGSSPAYVFMLIEAMADAGVTGGIPRDAAYKLAAQSVLGSAKMVLETGKHPAELKDMVCSPKGTTIEAVAELEARGFRSAIIEAIKKCNEKANNIK
ncbi:MAG: pyrroline-5-carboxylate reductase [Clostridia bacterium]|nr:pyrroline-5-carboxylate reductase [Clostridia bacterium]